GLASALAADIDVVGACLLEREADEFAATLDLRPVVELVAHDAIVARMERQRNPQAPRKPGLHVAPVMGRRKRSQACAGCGALSAWADPLARSGLRASMEVPVCAARRGRRMSTRRDFLRRVSAAGGYRATSLPMRAMGLLGASAAAEPL